MLKNYFRTAFRSLSKNRSYAIINISGLAVSLAAAILLLLWVWDELSFDRMHRKGERIYILATTLDIHSDNLYPVGPPPLAIYGKNEIPAIEDACRSSNIPSITIQHNDKKFNEEGKFVDPSFLRIFDFKLIKGDRANPFPDNQSIVLTEKLAKKYFGDTEAIGQIVQLVVNPTKPQKMGFKVTGVIQDIPNNSSITSDFLLPFALLKQELNDQDFDAQWGAFNYGTTFLLKAGSDSQQVAKQLADLHRKNANVDLFNGLVYFLQPLHKLHLFDAKGKEKGMQQVRIFALIAVVILLIACINYINLVTARSTRRSKEVGVRKVVGASRFHLFWQFISESFLVFLIAMILAIGITYLTMPIYNSLSGKEMVFSLLDSRIWILFGGALCLILVLAGVYPALMLVRFTPSLALRGITPSLGKNSGLRKTLVVVQFSCSVVLIVATLIVSKQLEYIRKKDLGYNKENVFLLPSQNFRTHFDAIRSDLEKEPGIQGVTIGSSNISQIGQGSVDLEWEGKPSTMVNFMVNILSVESNFLDVMNVKLLEGKGFTGTAADSSHIILNETAIKQMGIEQPIIGKPVTFRNRACTVVGIAKDFHFNNLKTPIGPLVLFSDPGAFWGTMYVKTASSQAPLAIAAVERLWKQYNADQEFDYKFLDETFDQLYRSDIRAGKLFNLFAGIAIALSCLGLFGLVTFTAETRVKEIGIRKTLGATVGNIILLISNDFLKLVGISFLVAFPLAWWMMSRWLENYVYRTDIQIWVFALAGFTAFTIAAITVCGKALKAARNNPVDAIRAE